MRTIIQADERKRVLKRVIWSISIMIGFGIACSTDRDWALALIAGLLLVILAIWGSLGNSSRAQWVNKSWATVLAPLTGIALVLVGQMLNMTINQQIGSLVRVLVFGTGFFSFTIACCLVEEKRNQTRPVRIIFWMRLLVISILLLAGLTWLMVSNNWGPFK